MSKYILFLGFMLSISAQSAEKEQKELLTKQEYNYLKFKHQDLAENEILREEISSTISPIKVCCAALTVLGFGACLFFHKKMPMRLYKNPINKTRLSGAPPMGAMIHEYVLNKSSNIKLSQQQEIVSIMPNNSKPIIIPCNHPVNIIQLKSFLREYPGLAYYEKTNDYTGQTEYYFDISELDTDAQKRIHSHLQFLNE